MCFLRAELSCGRLTALDTNRFSTTIHRTKLSFCCNYSVSGMNELRSSHSLLSIRDVLLFVTICALTVTLFRSYSEFRYIPFLCAIYLSSWRLHRGDESHVVRSMLFIASVAIISPVLFWDSHPDQREWNKRIGYQMHGSYAYPFLSLLPVPIVSFAWKCFRGDISRGRFIVESLIECVVLIPVWTLTMCGI